jgi:hypothetical protein
MVGLEVNKYLCICIVLYQHSSASCGSVVDLMVILSYPSFLLA